VCDTCQHPIGPPQHVSATCQHLIGPPHPCGSHMSDKWVPLVPRVSTPLVHLTQPVPHGRTLSHPVRPDKDIWQHLIGPHHKPHHHICHMATCEWSTPATTSPDRDTWHNHSRPLQHACATWHYTTEPPQQLLIRSLMLKGSV
jgi:hypothetical protein